MDEVRAELMKCWKKLSGLGRYKVLVYARLIVKIEQEKKAAGL